MGKMSSFQKTVSLLMCYFDEEFGNSWKGKVL